MRMICHDLEENDGINFINYTVFEHYYQDLCFSFDIVWSVKCTFVLS